MRLILCIALQIIWMGCALEREKERAGLSREPHAAAAATAAQKKVCPRLEQSPASTVEKLMWAGVWGHVAVRRDDVESMWGPAGACIRDEHATVARLLQMPAMIAEQVVCLCVLLARNRVCQ